MKDWIVDTLNKAHHSLENGELDAVTEILSVLDENKKKEGDRYAYVIEGYPKCSISISDYYLERGCLLAAFPERENEALESFCQYNYQQLQKKEGSELKDTKTYYSFRKANEYSYEDLANNTITLVSPKLMNDPLDTLMYPWLDAREEICEKKLEEGDFSEDYKRRVRNIGRIFRNSHDYYKIRSFCAWKKGDNEPPFQNTLMWSHYADSHKGFCVVYKFSPEMRFKRDAASYKTLKGMSYRSTPIDLTDATEFDGNMALLTKSSHWEYEKEFRLLMYDPSNKEDHYSMTLDKDSSVYAIIFGMKCCDSTKSIVRSILKDRKVRYYEMKEDPYNIYTLKLIEISNAK